MSISQEITRIQNAKASLKTSINAKTDLQHQITTETIDNYGNFVDSIPVARNWTTIGYTEEPTFINDGYEYAVQIKNNYDTSTTDWFQRYYQNHNLVFFPLIDTSNVETMRQAFRECIHLLKVPAITISTLCTNTGWMFGNCASLREIDFTNFNTSNVTNMDYMFFRCFTIYKETMPFNTSKVSTMEHMFEDCWNLVELDLSNFTSEAITTCANMFYNCRSLTKLDMRKFDFSRLSSSSSRTNMFGSSASYGPANNCLIIVKDTTQKNTLKGYFSRLSNIKTVDEYEASL